MNEHIVVSHTTKIRIETILKERLNNKDSKDYLDGFPWPETWYQTTLELHEFCDLFTFWDGIAWGLPQDRVPFTIEQSANYLVNENNKSITTDRVKGIRNIENQIRQGQLTLENLFLILVGQDQNGPFLIIDGNHRAVAAQLIKMKNKDFIIPLDAYIAHSEHMKQYSYYKRIL